MEILNWERRAAPRFRSEFPVELGACGGVTENLSLSGILFRVPVAPAVGEIRFDVVVNDEGSTPARLRCTGRVLRVVQQGDSAMVAAAIDDFWFESSRA